MSTAFVGDITVTSTKRGIRITTKGEVWGDPWSTPDSSIEVVDVEGLIKALRLVQQEKSYDSW